LISEPWARTKPDFLGTLGCAGGFPESEMRLRNVNAEERSKEEKFNILIRTTEFKETDLQQVHVVCSKDGKIHSHHH
jgi:hypothetical protein